MVALVEQLGDRLPRWLAAFRATRADPRQVGGDDIVLHDRRGRPLGRVSGAREGLETGPHAPTMYLRREA